MAAFCAFFFYFKNTTALPLLLLLLLLGVSINNNNNNNKTFMVAIAQTDAYDGILADDDTNHLQFSSSAREMCSVRNCIHSLFVGTDEGGGKNGPSSRRIWKPRKR